jgi:hypothetical protein
MASAQGPDETATRTCDAVFDNTTSKEEDQRNA